MTEDAGERCRECGTKVGTWGCCRTIRKLMRRAAEAATMARDLRAELARACELLESRGDPELRALAGRLRQHAEKARGLT